MTAPELERPLRLRETPVSGERPVTIQSLMRSAGQFRDAALVLIALSYGLGYLAWSTFAAAHGLGGVPALYADYVMTGLFPLLLLAAVYPLGRLLGLFRRWTRGTPSSRSAAISKGLSYVVSVLVLASLPLKWIFNDEIYSTILMITVVLWLARVVVARGLNDGFNRGMLIFVLWYLLTFAAVIGLVFYWERVFSRWPQELGGPRPRCVVFDVDASKVSPAMRGVLLGNAQGGDSSGIHSSRPLYSIFSGGDFVLLKVGPEPLVKREEVFRVPKSALGAESPCPTPSG